MTTEAAPIQETAEQFKPPFQAKPIRGSAPGEPDWCVDDSHRSVVAECHGKGSAQWLADRLNTPLPAIPGGEREAFEAWARREGHPTVRIYQSHQLGDYEDIGTRRAWATWQAARASTPTVNARKAADEIVRKARAAVLDSAIGGAWGTGLYNDSAAAQVFMDCFSEWADQHLAALILSHTGSPAAGLMDFAALLQRQMDWSSATFGPGPRSAGNIDHIRRELREIEAAPADLEEWIDVAMLAIDGAMREGHSPEAVLRGYAEKLEKNFARSWPDWRTADPTKAIEHDRLTQAQVGKP